jgi:hypothetical protein
MFGFAISVNYLSGCGTKKAALNITNTVDKTTVNVGDTVNQPITLTLIHRALPVRLLMTPAPGYGMWVVSPTGLNQP